MEKGQSLSNANKAMIVAEEKGSAEGASSSSSVPPIPTRGDSGPYDVFLSFHGSDSRKGFTDHLYRRLYDTGLRVFRDRDSIPIGDEFSSLLLDAITQSKISIPVISQNYASSKWCLHELVHIMKCKKSKSHIVLPIFFKVNPSDVRHLKGSFEKAFEVHSGKEYLDKKDIQEWQQALKEVSFLHGWESEKVAEGHEGDLVKLVVETVQSKLPKDFPLLVPKELVGLDGHMEKIMNWIDSPSNNARMIGIFGMGGIGKTTLAKCIYNQLCNKFEHFSFIPDIRENTKKHGIMHLQSQLIPGILQGKHEVRTIDEGVNLIKSTLSKKKVLILLDDIDHKNQLNALAEERNWFASESIIIVTTRNEAMLDQSKFEVDYKYPMSEIDHGSSLILFSRHAFRMDYPSRDFKHISNQIVSTMGGLPLALEVIGSYLYKKTKPGEWNDMLEQLKKQPHQDVKNILKISYDALQDGHKEIFLDIACFFIGESSKFPIYMWGDCGFHAHLGIEELKLRCLIKIEDDGILRMHDQLRDLGRSIVCEGQPLEERGRIWLSDEASKVLMEEKGTKKIRAICLDGRCRYYLRGYTNEQFKKLQKLRFLQLRGAALSGDFDKLFSELRWLQWFDIEPSLSFLATNLHLSELLVLQLSHKITEHWRGWSSIMLAKRLKVLDLEDCEYLRCTPELSTFRELEILILKNCSILEQVHPSIGQVKSLVSLDLSGCGSLKELPREVGGLRELKELILDFSGITEIPMSIGFMRKLEKLSARSCLSLTEIPNSIGDLQNLQHLDISESAISDLPESIRNLSSLQHLNQEGWNDLRLLPELPSSLTHLKLFGQGPKLPQLSHLIHMEELHISWKRST